MMRFTLALALAVSILTSSSAFAGDDEVIAKLTDVSIRLELKDPYSAVVTITKTSVIGDHAGGLVCGFVNGKNSYGAYIGNRPFTFMWAKIGGKITPMIVTVYEDGKSHADECDKKG